MYKHQSYFVQYNDENAGEKFSSSLHNNGFAIVRADYFEKGSINTLYRIFQEFFSSDAKFNYLFNPDSQQGYYPMQSENAKTTEVKDLKEMYHYFPTGENPELIKKSADDVYIKTLLLTQILLDWLDTFTPKEISQQFPQSLLSSLNINSKTLLRILCYPVSEDFKEGEIRATEHEDISVITLLLAANCSGLEIKQKNGEWLPVVAEDETDVIVINGDVLQEYSHHYYQSATHRVKQWPENGEKFRFASAFFVHIKPEITLPNGLKMKEFFAERMRQIGLGKNGG